MCGWGSACECVGGGAWAEVCNDGCRVCGTREGSGVI